jgi:hypothetical protein
VRTDVPPVILQVYQHTAGVVFELGTRRIPVLLTLLCVVDTLLSSTMSRKGRSAVVLFLSFVFVAVLLLREVVAQAGATTFLFNSADVVTSGEVFTSNFLRMSLPSGICDADNPCVNGACCSAVCFFWGR